MVEEEDCRIPCSIACFCPCFKEELEEHYAKWKLDFPPKKTRVVQYTRTESGRLFGEDDPSNGSRVVVFVEVK